MGNLTDRNSIWELYSQRVLQYADRPAYSFRSPKESSLHADWACVSWTSDFRNALACSKAISRCGVKGIHSVGLLSDFSYGWLLCEKALFKLGCRVTGVDRQLLSQSEQEDFLIADEVNAPSLQSLLPEFEYVDTLVIDLESSTGSHVWKVQVFRNSRSTVAINKCGSRVEGAALGAFTSGSSGVPSFFSFSQSQVSLAVRAISRRLSGVEVGWRSISYLPLSALYQRVFNFCAIQLGVHTCCLDDSKRIFSEIQRFEAHYIISVPLILEKAFPDSASRGPQLGFLDTLKFIVTGSAKTPSWIIDVLEGQGVAVLEGYGMTECIIPISFNSLSARKIGTVGRPFEENILSTERDGLLSVDGPGLALELKGSPLKTNDLVAFDKDGYLKLIGRKSSTVKLSNGTKVQLETLEKPYEHFSGFGPCVIGQNPDGSLYGIATCDAVSSDALDLDERSRVGEVFRQKVVLANKDLPNARVVRNWLILPRAFSAEKEEVTRTGKIHRKNVRSKYEEIASRSPSAPKGTVVEWLN